MLYALCDRKGRIFLSDHKAPGLEVVGYGAVERLEPALKALAERGAGGDWLVVPGVAEATDTEQAKAIASAFHSRVLTELRLLPGANAGEPS